MAASRAAHQPAAREAARQLEHARRHAALAPGDSLESLSTDGCLGLRVELAGGGCGVVVGAEAAAGKRLLVRLDGDEASTPTPTPRRDARLA